MYITLRDHNVYYQKLGEGKDLIMLHGWKQDVSTFHNVSEELKKHFTLWLIDLPGFGRSENPKQAFMVGDYAGIVTDFIKKNQLEKPHLLGHSVGGNIAIKLASENGELIDKLVLESSSGIRPPKGVVRYLIYAGAKVFHYMIPNFLNIKDRIRHKFYWKLESDYLNAGGLRNTLTNILNEDLSGSLSKIRNQTLLIWGEGDGQVNIKYAKQMYRKIPNSKLEILEGTGHFPHTEKPGKFLYFILDFLS